MDENLTGSKQESHRTRKIIDGKPVIIVSPPEGYGELWVGSGGGWKAPK